MHRPSLIMGALLGGLTGLALMALLFLGEQFAGLPFVPFDIFDWLARVLPGDVVTLGIDLIVNVILALDLGSTGQSAKLIEQLMALGLWLAGTGLAGWGLAWLMRPGSWADWRVGALAGIVLFLFAIGVEVSLGISGDPALAYMWLGLTLVGWGALLGNFLDGLGQPAPEAAGTADEARASRRAVLRKIVVSSLAVALAAWGLGSLFKGQREASGAGRPLTGLKEASDGSGSGTAGSDVAGSDADDSDTAGSDADASDAAGSDADDSGTAGSEADGSEADASGTAGSEAGGSDADASEAGGSDADASDAAGSEADASDAGRIEPAPGTRPEVTPNEDFYRIDINTRPVVIDGQSWALEVEGLFNKPRPLTLADLMAFPAVTRPITLACISNRIGGDLIGASNWTGLRLPDLLEDLGLLPQAQELFIEADDGFFESVAMADMMDPRTLLVYGMNGQTLPVEHGFPLRIYIPNRYGMKQPKWITRLEAIGEKGPGYWVKRGWSAEARPNIISIIDTVAVDEAVEGRVPIGGIAWAGDRGIKKVELQVDEGEWVEASLRAPPLSPLTWVQWRYDWPGAPGRHTFTVRATDGAGALQIGESRLVRPDGATGYHLLRVKI